MPAVDGTVGVMTKHIWTVGALALATVGAACGSDDDGQIEIPEEGTGNPYTQAIIESTSHDEVLLPGGDMVVAVNCTPEGGGLPIVTAVANGLGSGTYVGVFEPSTGVDLSLQVAGPENAVGIAQMELTDAEYVVTFDSIGVEFDLRGC